MHAYTCLLTNWRAVVCWKGGSRHYQALSEEETGPERGYLARAPQPGTDGAPACSASLRARAHPLPLGRGGVEQWDQLVWKNLEIQGELGLREAGFTPA